MQKECLVNDLHAGAKLEELRVQLLSLLATVEGYQNILYSCTPLEAGSRARGFLPNIKVSLQGMLHNFSEKEGTSQAGPSQPGSSHKTTI